MRARQVTISLCKGVRRSSALVLPQPEPEGHALHSSNVRMLPVNRASELKSISMKSLQAVVASLALLAVGAPGIGGVVFAHDEEDFPPRRSGLSGWLPTGLSTRVSTPVTSSAVSGLGYENHAASHGLDDAGPFYAGMHEGEHVGYDQGFRAGTRKFHRRHHHDDDDDRVINVGNESPRFCNRSQHLNHPFI